MAHSWRRRRRRRRRRQDVKRTSLRQPIDCRSWLPTCAALGGLPDCPGGPLCKSGGCSPHAGGHEGWLAHKSSGLRSPIAMAGTDAPRVQCEGRSRAQHQMQGSLTSSWPPPAGSLLITHVGSFADTASLVKAPLSSAALVSAAFSGAITGCAGHAPPTPSAAASCCCGHR